MLTLFFAISLISVRDSATGIAVPAEVRESRGRLRVRAEGYEAIETGAGDLPVTIWIDPRERPAELQPHVVAAQIRTGFLFVHGHVTDRDTGEPLQGVAVTATGVASRSDHRGYFSMHLPAVRETENFRFEGEGLMQHTITNTLITDGADVHFLVRMERGHGVTVRDDGHKIWMHREGGEHPLREEVSSGEHTGADDVVIPETIRVGFECPSANTCARVEVFTLDTYVKRGLNDEWIASWPDNSLRAGAVAYRSYGAWHVAHPRTPSYDICSTTSCQVNDPDTSLRTDLAVDATRGWVLISNGEIFRSEYSAENNNLLGDRSCSNVFRSCGDGFAGSPAAGWPCLSDSVCAGSSCFGHGRGMCQWGTQRWSLLGADWRWILNHYYNDSGRPGGLRSAYAVGPEGEKRPRRRATGR
ncbi:MAG TPA: SpoIID/LytB domain-containing protein [Thermoanaerobaculia bacterium]|nr:SpoIID/LytB domain-containing protein [Thermoanaerobaculia bacterium]